jgi:predicted  nucleic acid-binding Zn-ribbon protein
LGVWQLAARNLMIENKEDGIADVKGKLKDVENQKYILNYKVDSLSKAAAPREMKLDRMVEKMKEMDQDLQGQMSALQRQKLLNRDLKGRIKAMDEEVRNMPSMFPDCTCTLNVP